MRFKQIKTAMNLFHKQGWRGVSRVLGHKLIQAGRTGDVGSSSEPLPEYIRWLTYANAGMLTPGNLSCIDHAIKNLPSGAPIIEIGSFCGLSTNIISYMKEKYGAKNPLFTCDKWEFEGAQPGTMLGESKSVSHADYRSFVKDTYIRNIQMFSQYDLPYTIEAFSDAFFDAWSKNERRIDILNREVELGGPISFCFIDGNHTYDYAKRDYENVDRYLEVGGFILFDDSGDDYDWGSCKVAKEVAGTGRYKVVAKNPNYFFEKLK